MAQIQGGTVRAASSASDRLGADAEHRPEWSQDTERTDTAPTESRSAHQATEWTKNSSGPRSNVGDMGADEVYVKEQREPRAHFLSMADLGSILIPWSIVVIVASKCDEKTGQ